MYPEGGRDLVHFSLSAVRRVRCPEGAQKGPEGDRAVRRVEETCLRMCPEGGSCPEGKRILSVRRVGTSYPHGMPGLLRHLSGERRSLQTVRRV